MTVLLPSRTKQPCRSRWKPRRKLRPQQLPRQRRGSALSKMLAARRRKTPSAVARMRRDRESKKKRLSVRTKN